MSHVSDPSKDGFPSPLRPPIQSFNEYGFPKRQACDTFNWPNGYYANETGQAFQALYDDTPQRDAWANFWAEVARVFGGVTHVLGYELINEPWAGDVYKYPEHIVPGFADRLALGPAYDALNEVCFVFLVSEFLFFWIFL